MMMTRPKPLKDVRILLLEDDALISIDTEDMLLGLGAARVLVAHTLAEAEAIVEAEPVDAAVLDLLIGKTRCEAFAARLVAGRLPVIFASGFASGFGDSGLPEALRGVPVIQKPYSPQALQAALALALAEPGAGGIPPRDSEGEPSPAG